MNTRTKTAATVLLALGLLTGCAQPSLRGTDMNLALREARTQVDHEALAKRYEQDAREAETKIEEQQKLLDHYKEHSYLYGKQALTLEEQCDALIHHYQTIADKDLQMAKLHHRIAENTL